MDKDRKREEFVSEHLEPRPWRTTQRENSGDFEQRATAGKWAAILTAVINYQNHHNGASPTDLIISRDTNLSVGVVRYHLREMEKKGLVTDVKGWPRYIIVANAAKVQKISQLEVRKTEDRKMNTEHEEPRGRGGRRASPTGRKAFMVRAKEVAEAIVDHYDQYAKPPSISWVNERVWKNNDYTKSGGSASRTIKQMADLGWVHHRSRCKDLTLTGLGRAALFGQLDERLHTDTPINPVEVRSAPQPTPEQPMIPRHVPPPIWQQRAAPAFQIRKALPPEANKVDLKAVPDVDLIVELNGRGFRVTR